MNQSPYRERAVEAAASPGDIDRPVELVKPRMWLTALAIGLVVIGGLVWLALAGIRPPVNGLGTVSAGGFEQLTASVSGTVRQVPAANGAPVSEGSHLMGITAEGRTTWVDAPANGTVMQLLVGEGFAVTKGQPVLNFAFATQSRQFQMLIPGLEVTEITRGDVEIGAPLIVQPDSSKPIECTVATLSAYPVAASDIEQWLTDPYLISYVREQGAVAFVQADCPPGSLDSLRPGTAIPAFIELSSRSALQIVFGQ